MLDRNFLIPILLGLSCICSQDAPPNFVIIFTDDQGYQDLESYGHPSIKTPNIDNMALEGMRFTDFHVAASVCTPSRLGLMTGSYPVRVGWELGVFGYLISNDKGMNPDEVTLAEILKLKGYTTACIGKWHLGNKVPFMPNNQGFDYYFGLPYSNNMNPKLLYQNKEVIENPFDNKMLTSQFTDEAVSFINSNKDRPFFLYVPHTAPHFPVEPHPDWSGASAFGDYGDVIEELDWSTGKILEALADNGLDENTLVIYASDNGPQGGEDASALPLRGMKWDAFEGGNRVPCIMRWPGKVPAGTINDGLASSIDILPTIAGLAGINLAHVYPTPVIDGVDVWDYIQGYPDAENPRQTLLYWHGQEGYAAIRVGEFKVFPESGEMYNVSAGNDLGEATDIAEENSALFDSIVAVGQELLSEIEDNLRPLGDINLNNWSDDSITLSIPLPDNKNNSIEAPAMSSSNSGPVFNIHGKKLSAGLPEPRGLYFVQRTDGEGFYKNINLSGP